MIAKSWWEILHNYCFLDFSLFIFTGWIYDHSGSYDAGFVYLGAVEATGALIFAADHLRQNYNRDEKNKLSA